MTLNRQPKYFICSFEYQQCNRSDNLYVSFLYKKAVHFIRLGPTFVTVIIIS